MDDSYTGVIIVEILDNSSSTSASIETRIDYAVWKHSTSIVEMVKDTDERPPKIPFPSIPSKQGLDKTLTYMRKMNGQTKALIEAKVNQAVLLLYNQDEASNLVHRFPMEGQMPAKTRLLAGNEGVIKEIRPRQGFGWNEQPAFALVEFTDLDTGKIIAREWVYLKHLQDKNNDATERGKYRAMEAWDDGWEHEYYETMKAPEQSELLLSTLTTANILDVEKLVHGLSKFTAEMINNKTFNEILAHFPEEPREPPDYSGRDRRARPEQEPEPEPEPDLGPDQEKPARVSWYEIEGLIDAYEWIDPKKLITKYYGSNYE